jgi:hypothetical protein
MIGAVVRMLRAAIVVAVIAGVASHFLRVPVDVALGYCLVGWWARALLRGPLRRVARRGVSLARTAQTHVWQT